MPEEYTLETLIELNRYHHNECEPTTDDVYNVNYFRRLIETTRSDLMPKVGDIVEVTLEDGTHYYSAHVEGDDYKGGLYVCLLPQTPFVFETLDGRLAMYARGDLWRHIPRQLKRIGVRKKQFQVWKHGKQLPYEGVLFQAHINVWEYVESI